MTDTLLTNLAVILVAMSLLWLVATARSDVSLVDPFWGLGFVLVGWCSAAINWPTSERSLLLAVLTTVWGLRLSGYLVYRNWGQGEDRRYRAMRDAHGSRFWWISWFTVFALQGVILWIVSLPLQTTAVVRAATSWSWLDVVGLIVWMVGMGFETVGDWQLSQFKANLANAGRVMDRGLWRYTRHPNYFGDFCVWWGVFIIASQMRMWWTLVSPVLMSLLLMRISGVSLLESTITDRRPDYADYQRRTSAFFPGKPRRIPDQFA